MQDYPKLQPVHHGQVFHQQPVHHNKQSEDTRMNMAVDIGGSEYQSWHF